MDINSLKEIKSTLENNMNNDDSETDIESDSEPEQKTKKKTKVKDYKKKYNDSESRYRYLQLEMVNKDIEISELKEKLNNLDKFTIFSKNVNFLFDRLNNAIKVLNERINTINDDDYIKLSQISSLNHIEGVCKKTIEKYETYLSSEVYPHIDNDQLFIKLALDSLYINKKKEFDSILVKIKNKRNLTLFNNGLMIFGLITGGILLLSSVIYVCYYFF